MKLNSSGSDQIWNSAKCVKVFKRGKQWLAGRWEALCGWCWRRPPPAASARTDTTPNKHEVWPFQVLKIRRRTSFVVYCIPVQLVGKRKQSLLTLFKSPFPITRICFLLKYKPKTRRDEPEKTKKDEVLSSSFRVRFFYPYISIRNKFTILKMDFLNNVNEDCFLFPFCLTSLTRTQAKDEGSRRKRFVITC
jgi:hypothetical protein